MVAFSLPLFSAMSPLKLKKWYVILHSKTENMLYKDKDSEDGCFQQSLKYYYRQLLTNPLYKANIYSCIIT